MTQESRTQETPTPAPDRGELTDAALAQVVGGTEGPPPGAGGSNGRS